MSESRDGEPVVLARLGQNNYFGETSLMNDNKCNATVVSVEDSILLRLHKSQFDRFLAVAPELEDVFVSRMSARTAARLRRIPFFFHIKENKPWNKLDLLGGLFVFETMKKGEMIFEEGSVGEKFYVIIDGNISYVSSLFLSLVPLV